MAKVSFIPETDAVAPDNFVGMHGSVPWPGGG